MRKVHQLVTLPVPYSDLRLCQGALTDFESLLSLFIAICTGTCMKLGRCRLHTVVLCAILHSKFFELQDRKRVRACGCSLQSDSRSAHLQHVDAISRRTDTMQTPPASRDPCSFRRSAQLPRAAASTSSTVGTEHYAKYLHALRAVEIRFPVSSDSSHVNVSFKWHDSFVDGQSCAQKNIHFEKAAVLFCLGALESQRGAEVSRDSQAGIAECIKAFSLSAGAPALFHFLATREYARCAGHPDAVASHSLATQLPYAGTTSAW